MGKKLGLSSLLFKLKDTPRPSCYSSSSTPKTSWPWPSCKKPKTNSFRDTEDSHDSVYKTVNSVYFESSASEEHDESFTTLSDETSDVAHHRSMDTVVRELRTAEHRLFFEPGDTSSILEEAKSGEFPFKESMVMSMESDDPYCDFRKSMEEMVLANRIKDWQGLENLLVWYLRVNGKKTHGIIIGAFVDFLVAFASQTSTSTTTTSSNSTSSSNSIGFEVDDDRDHDRSEEQSN